MSTPTLREAAQALKPCPFCGGDSTAPSHSQHRPGCYFLVLASAKAAPKGDVSWAPDLLEAWNRRAPAADVGVEPVAFLSTDSIGERYLCFSRPMDDAPCEDLHTATQLHQAVARARGPYLQPDDMKALERLHECLDDDEEYDVPKAALQRLAELGAVRHHAAGRYSITTFGRIVLGESLFRLPLETMDECNARLGQEAAAIRARKTP